MNLVFDKNTLKVVSAFDNSFSGTAEDLLKSMFPQNYTSLSLWIISIKIHQNPMFLSVKLDENKNPDILFYKGREIYRASQEEKIKAEDLRLERGREALAQLLPRVLRTSVNQDIIKLWSTSPYTDKPIVNSLKSFDYFLDQKTIPASWWGTFVDAGGYGNMNRSIVFRLHNHHVIAKSEIVPSLPQISQLG